MESFELNKMAGAILGTLLFAMALGILSDALFYRSPSKVPGWNLPAASEAPTAEASAAPAATDEPLPKLLAAADATKGKADAAVCTTCHNFAKGAGAKVGPELYGVVGRHKGTMANYAYSEGMKGKGGDWTFDDINAFITNPRAYVSGTKMGYGGEKDPHKRADIIAYLDTLSDQPVPLPKP